LANELCQIVGDELFFTWHIFLEVGKTQDLPSKIWQTLGDARNSNSSPSQVVIVIFFGKNRKNLFQQFPISGCYLSRVGKNGLRARIYARNDPRRILPY
jgi:hypothetical protein